jgi:hypothetical protein
MHTLTYLCPAGNFISYGAPGFVHPIPGDMTKKEGLLGLMSSWTYTSNQFSSVFS